MHYTNRVRRAHDWRRDFVNLCNYLFFMLFHFSSEVKSNNRCAPSCGGQKKKVGAHQKIFGGRRAPGHCASPLANCFRRHWIRSLVVVGYLVNYTPMNYHRWSFQGWTFPGNWVRSNVGLLSQLPFLYQVCIKILYTRSGVRTHADICPLDLKSNALTTRPFWLWKSLRYMLVLE